MMMIINSPTILPTTAPAMTPASVPLSESDAPGVPVGPVVLAGCPVCCLGDVVATTSLVVGEGDVPCSSVAVAVASGVVEVA